MKHFTPAPLADTGDLCGECPVWDPERQAVFWTDCVGLRFHRLDWGTKAYTLVRGDIEVYGFRRNRSGGFVVTNTGGAWLWDVAGALQLIAAEAEGERCQLNDC
jgi:sugar lactone lactonase YvrE